jgi:hypothetical protein
VKEGGVMSHYEVGEGSDKDSAVQEAIRRLISAGHKPDDKKVFVRQIVQDPPTFKAKAHAAKRR